MSEPTKACNLTADEIDQLINWHGHNLGINSAVARDHTDSIERLKYLNSRLKSFKEPAADVKSAPEAASGWASN